MLPSLECPRAAAARKVHFPMREARARKHSRATRACCGYHDPGEEFQAFGELLCAAIGMWHEDPSKDLAYLRRYPWFRNCVVKAVPAVIQHDRCIRVSAGND